MQVLVLKLASTKNLIQQFPEGIKIKPNRLTHINKGIIVQNDKIIDTFTISENLNFNRSNERIDLKDIVYEKDDTLKRFIGEPFKNGSSIPAIITKL